MNDPALDNALRLRRAGRLAEAAEIYAQILRANPRHFEALHALGILRYQSGQIDEAERLIGAAIAVEPRAADANYNRGCLQMKLGRLDDAIASFGGAIAVKPDYVEALTNRGGAFMQRERYAEAKADFDAVLARAPALPQAWNNAGSASTKLRRYDEALQQFDKALALRPDYAEAWKNRGLALLLHGFPEKAFADFDKAVALDPNSAEAWEQRGEAMAHFRPVEAIESYDRSLRLRPGHAKTLFSRANMLFSVRRFEDAAAGYRAVLEKDPGYENARGALFFALQSCCDWTCRHEDLRSVRADMKAGSVALAPFHGLVLLDDPADMQTATRRFVAKQHPAQEPLRRATSRRDRIHVAYLSANFNDHAVGRLIAGVFDSHDKRRFETTGISFVAAQGEMHSRIGRAFEHFLDASARNDRDVAQILVDREVDIAVDLMGFTENCRPGIFAFRPAPIQVNYLGFPGTIGADYIDYIIADRFVIPDDQQRHFTEQIVRLPDCYLPNDAGRRMKEPVPTRGEAGLPETGFVFCSFNQTYKFTPEMFDIWMRLLRATNGSVLWLPVSASVVMLNLRREAEARGVAAERLVFAPFAETVEDHLSRLRLADLFLDTLPYNSHTSTCDALFANVPVVTCPGTTFAGRVAASALHAHGVSELIADSLGAYEELALSMARDPQKVAALKAKIARHHDTHALFDTARFTRHLERAFTGMWERHQRTEPPQGFAVESIGARV
jgi:predicted O-linked N-acetylglucosamine transferase (SPINDLY family)